MSFFDYAILGLIALLAALAVRAIRRGKGKCSSSCSACPYRNGCRKQKRPGA